MKGLHRSTLITVDNERYIAETAPLGAAVRHLKTGQEVIIERRAYGGSGNALWLLDGRPYKTLKAAVEAWHSFRTAFSAKTVKS
jgi:hypothetical protein